MQFDLDEAQLRQYVGTVAEPDDYDEFWRASVDQARAASAPVKISEVPCELRTLSVREIEFGGYGGEPIKAWLRVPRGARGPLPTIVEFVGYGGGRGRAAENLYWASCGFAHLQVDSRGQGSEWSLGSTADPHGSGPQFPGMLTKGIGDPQTSYYRRLGVDGIRALEVVQELSVVNREAVVTYGHSQGGWLAVLAGSLGPGAAAVVAEVPFLCDIARAIRLTDAHPYQELVRYLATHREEVEQVHTTLSYIDGVNAARRGSAPAYFSAGQMDAICPPSTVAAAANSYGGPHELVLWPFNGHEAGAGFDLDREREFLKTQVGIAL